MKTRAALSLVLCLCFYGCIERQRVNADCEWTDAAFAMDLRVTTGSIRRFSAGSRRSCANDRAMAAASRISIWEGKIV